MNKYLSFAACTLLLAACNEKPGYEITGTVSNADLNGKFVYLYAYGDKEAAPKDSAIVENGSFRLKGVQAEPALHSIRFAEDVIEPVRPEAGENAPFSAIFLLENGKLTASLEESGSFVAGTPENDEQTNLYAEIKTMRTGLAELYEKMKSEDPNISEAAAQKIEEIDHKITDKITDYILSNSDKQSAAKNLNDFHYYISEEKQNEIIAKAGELFKSVPGIGRLIEHLDVLKKVAVGKSFTDFEMADTKGEVHKLSDFIGKGKVVLIDFWASWCPPCRREMPALVALHKQYKNKGFDIVGISLDNKAEAWEKGISDLGITWTQLSDLKGWANEGAALYGVNSIPHTVLIDKEGTIIAKNLHGEELENKLKELLK